MGALKILGARAIHGSTGAEIWSSFAWAMLALYWLFYGLPPVLGNMLSALVGTWSRGPLWIWMLIGTVHAVMLFLRSSPHTILVRKICTALELIAWTSITIAARNYATALFLFPVLVLLMISIARRHYFDITIGEVW